MLRKALIPALLLVLVSALGVSACKKSDKPESSTTAPSNAASAGSDKRDIKPAEPAEPALATIEKPFFYHVTGPNEAAGYILGTMHMGIDAEKEFPAAIWKARDAAKVVAIEADISDMSLAAGLMLPPDTNLQTLLGDEYWAKLEAALGAAQAAMYKPMKPAAAASALAVKGLPMTMPMDLLIMSKARDQGQDLQFLESAQFQLDLLNQVMTVDFLKDMLDKADDGESVKMLTTYREGDEVALEAMNHDTEAWGKDPEKTIELMLFKRNDSWIPKLETMLATKSAFVAVGAAHLLGERGVLQQLRNKGYTVERVTGQ